MIRKLPQVIIQQIAAGEVVERPASVLKELVENSIDAEASQIKVEYEAGGIRRLSVSDNGRGIEERDVPLVFESHATSKLQKLEDFDCLQTMGFRGEAMSSISAVARVQLWTCARDSAIGLRASTEFGHWRGIKPADRRVGTEVVVEDLFSRLPVRSKFLKSPVAEARALQSTLKKIALAYPQIDFSLHEFGRGEKFHWPRTNLFERVLEFFDATDARHWFQSVPSEDAEKSSGLSSPWKVSFVFLEPRYFQSSRQNLQIYLNRRMIRDRKLEFAVRRAFEGYTETPQLSTGALFIEGDPSRFDVNVHPTKMEIRFQDPEEVFSAVVHALRDRLQVLHQDQVQAFKAKSENTSFFARSEPELSRVFTSSDAVPEVKNFQLSSRGETKVSVGSLDEPVAQGALGFQSAWEYLGCIDSTYWVVKAQGELFLFDQHALHERILYEELWSQYKDKGQISSQRLLFPLDLKFEQVERLEEQRSFLESMGFDWHQNQRGTWQLIAVPALIKRNVVEILRELLQGESAGREAALRSVLSTMACHSAIRAGDAVSPSLALELLDKFKSEDALGHCPHGRPTFVKLSSRDLEKLFHRA